MNQGHPDIVAYLAGGLSEAKKAEAAQHIESCRDCALLEREVSQTLSLIHGVAGRFAKAHPDPEDRRRTLQLLMGPASGPDEAALPAEDLDPLPGPLAKAVAGLGRTSLLSRVKKSVEALTGKSGEAAHGLAERVLSSNAAAVPAIRKDATKVEDRPDTPGPDKDED